MTLAVVEDAIHAQWPELADLLAPADPELGYPGKSVDAFTSNAGFRIVLFHGFGDCPSGCITREYFYFETDDHCAPVKAGEYRAIYSASNCYTVVGEPLWGIPEGAASESSCEASTLPPGFNQECLEASCPIGLTPTTFEGVSGQQCLCMIHCMTDDACPQGTSCQNPIDVPGHSCYE